MQKLEAVEAAKSLFDEAKDWGLWRWLTEKSRARRTADAAWEALDAYEKKVKAGWSDDLKKAYREAAAAVAANGNARGQRKLEMAIEEAKDVDPELRLAARKFKNAEDEAYNLHMKAEATFDDADRRLSTGMACEGAQQAIDAWIAREKVIRKAESLGRR